MQVFVPVPDPQASVQMLDLKRLGKQVIECQQIYRAIVDPSYGWQHHPATKMWRDNPGGLLHYATWANHEWHERRGKDHGAFINLLRHAGVDYGIASRAALDPPVKPLYPWWWGDERVHLSHQSNLRRKDPVHYTFAVPDNLPYYWPTKEQS